MTSISHPDYFLTTERLGFRAWRSADMDLAMALWGDPEVTRLISANGHLTPAEVKARLERELSIQNEHGVQYWPMFILSDGALAGCCGLRPYRPEEGIYELGVHLRPLFWRQGLAMEAARGVIAYAFEQPGIRGLFAGHNPANEASRGLLLKLGFRYTHEEFYEPTGLHHPSYLLEKRDGPVEH
jgi:RimJ/RimL family protein N-acetyltransferase